MRCRWLVALAVVMATAPASVAFAQTTGRIAGTTVDQQGGAMPGVTVTVTSPQLQGARNSVTDSVGEFRFLSLPPGTYLLKAELSGFKTVERPNIIVGLDQTVTLNLTMPVATMNETVTVEAATPVVDTTGTTQGIVAGQEMFNQLPVRRDFYSIARVAPGVTSDYYGPAFMGATSAENNYIIDGLNTTGVNTGTEGKVLNFDFVQEVEVKTGGLNAEYGRLTGGAINVLTKSGGNVFHGDVFGFGEPQQDQTIGSQLPTWATTRYNTARRDDYGADLGGFIVKDRLWFFGAYDRINQRDDISVVRFISPYAPAPGSLFSANTKRNNYAGKATLRLSNSHTITGSVFGDPNTLSGPVITTVSPPGYGINGPVSTFSGTLDRGGTDSTVRYDGVLTSHTLVRASFGQHRERQVYGGVGATTVAFLDQTVNPTANSGGFGTGFDDQHFTRNVVRGDLSHVWGNHDIKVGADYENVAATVDRFAGGGGQRLYQLRTGGVIFYRHRYFVNDRAAGFSRSDPSTWQIALPLIAQPVTQNTSAYAQDSYKILPNLTANFGLRWERQNVENRDQVSAFDLTKNFAPRIGVIWDPSKTGKSKIYGNWGRFYENIPMDINIRAFGGELTAFSYNFDPSPADVLPNPAAPRRSTLLGGPEPVDPSLKGQYVDEWIGGGEYEIRPNTVLGAKVSYRRLGRVIEDFLIPSQGDYFIANPGEGTLGLSIGNYDQVTTSPAPKAQRKNTAVELSLRKRYSNNWQFLGSYVWSKLEGNYDGTFQNSTGQLDPNINSAFDYGDFMVNSYGNLTNDRRHQVKMDGSYVVSRGMLDGLNFGGSLHVYSGVPLTAYGYSFAYANWEYYLSPRGSLGRGPVEWEGDIHAGYPLKLGPAMKANLMLDIFNLFNRQGPIVPDQRYNLVPNGVCAGIPGALCNGDGGLQPIPNSNSPVGQIPNLIGSATNPDFLKRYTIFTPPRSFRFGVRFTF